MALESFTFTVGKLDAGMAILLGDRAHLIEFPSVLLPPGASTGSIVNIAVHQNHAAEKRRDEAFWSLQADILGEFGVRGPDPPKLEVRNTTQTSVTLEWAPIRLATAKLRSLDIYRNGQRLAAIPSPHTNTSTKLSGLETDAPYTFQLILRTTAGTFPSNLIRLQTHTLLDTSGISVCFGHIDDDRLKEEAIEAIGKMGGKWSERIQIDTTHFVCTSPAVTPSGAEVNGGTSGSFGVEYQRALQLSIPVVQPHWLLACHSEKKMVPIASYNLSANPSAPFSASSANLSARPQSMSHVPVSSSSSSAQPAKNVRASMPAVSRHQDLSRTESASPFVNQPTAPTSPGGGGGGGAVPQATRHRFSEPVPEEVEPETTTEEVTLEPVPSHTKPTNEGTKQNEEGEGEREGESPPSPSSPSPSEQIRNKSRAGTMNRAFKFPTPVTSPVVEPAEFKLEKAPTTHKRSASSISRNNSREASVKEEEQVPPVSAVREEEHEHEHTAKETEREKAKTESISHQAMPSTVPIQVPPPPPVEKDASVSSRDVDGEEVGDTEEISLN